MPEVKRWVLILFASVLALTFIMSVLASSDYEIKDLIAYLNPIYFLEDNKNINITAIGDDLYINANGSVYIQGLNATIYVYNDTLWNDTGTALTPKDTGDGLYLTGQAYIDKVGGAIYVVDNSGSSTNPAFTIHSQGIDTVKLFPHGGGEFSDNINITTAANGETFRISDDDADFPGLLCQYDGSGHHHCYIRSGGSDSLVISDENSNDFFHSDGSTNTTTISKGVLTRATVNGQNVCLTNGTNCPPDDNGQSFDQSLNTTNNVTFNGIETKTIKTSKFNDTGTIPTVKGLYVQRVGANEYSTSSYATLLIDGRNNAGGVLVTRDDRSKQPFVGFAVWDYDGSERAQYNCGGGWGAPACTIQYGFFSKAYNVETGTDSDDMQYLATFRDFIVRPGENDMSYTYGTNNTYGANLGGTLITETDQTNTTGSAGVTLSSKTIKAKSMATHGDAIHFTYIIDESFSIGQREFNVTWGGVTVYSSGRQSVCGGDPLKIEGWITREGPTSQKVYTRLDEAQGGCGFNQATYTKASATLAINNVLALRAFGDTGGVRLETTRIEWLPGVETG